MAHARCKMTNRLERAGGRGTAMALAATVSLAGAAGAEAMSGRPRPMNEAAGSSASAAVCGPADGTAGVDRRGVKRKGAPLVHEYKTGSLKRARAIMLCSRFRTEGRRDLVQDVHARTTQRAQEARLKTLHRLARDGEFDLLPMTVDKLELICGALKRAKYRSGRAYISLWRCVHLREGHAWSERLGAACRDCIRSLERGLGPARRAHTVELERIMAVGRHDSPVVGGGPICPVDVIVCASLWMMRGLEAASVLGDQASISEDETSATIDLGPTKTNPTGRECPRTLRCCCRVEPSKCPVHALLRIMAARRRMGMSDQDALFPTPEGMASSRRGIIGSLRSVSGSSRLTEHSMRRMGAQYYARHGVSNSYIEFMGRWGSATVLLYIGEALQNRASESAVIAARGSSSSESSAALCARLRQSHHLADVNRRRGDSDGDAVGAEIASIAAEWLTKIRSEIQAAKDEVSKDWLIEQRRQWGGVRRAANDTVHEVLIGHAPFSTSIWVTRCGWSFGQARHERCRADDITCRKCLLYSSGKLGM